MVPKAKPGDLLGRFREIVSDPLNVLIERVPDAGLVENNLVTLHNGIRVHASGPASYYDKFSAVLVFNRGVHEPLEEYIFQEMLAAAPRSPVMLELGAYWGHYSMWLKRARPEARVILVEPDLGNLGAGERNFAVNGMKGEFHHGKVARGMFEVDTFLASQQLDRLDILHSDIQGAEGEMLDGATDLFSRRAASYVFISTHSETLHRGVISRLQGFGYRVEVTADLVHETTAHDGLVFATSPDTPALFGAFTPAGRERICAMTARQRVEYLSKVLGASVTT